MKRLQTALYTLFFLLLFASPLLAIEYNGIGGVPAYPREDNPRTESIFVYENAPGSVVEDGIVVINNSSETKTILVYATDTTPSSGGAFACKQYSEEVTDEGTWFELSKSEVILEPNSNEIVPFSVNIPNDLSAGEYNACVVVQEKIEDTVESGINLNFRAAIRAMVLIPGDMNRQLSIDTFKYHKEEEKNMLTLVLANTGNVSLDTDILLDVKNFVTGKEFFKSDSEYSILHSNNQEFNYDLDSNPWGGLYRANVNVSYIANDGERNLTEEIVFLIVPSIYALGGYAIALIVLLTTIFLLIDSKTRIKKAIGDAEEYIVKEGDTLTSIGKEQGVSWKLIAKVNSKKPPYEITVSERLLIPVFKKRKKKEDMTPVQPTTAISNEEVNNGTPSNPPQTV